MLHIEAVLHLLHSAHGKPHLIYRHAKAQGDGDGRNEIGYIALAYQSRLKRILCALGRMYHKSRALLAVYDISGVVIRILGLYAIAQGCGIGHLARRGIRKVIVHEHKAPGRYGIGKFKLGALHILDCLERLEMLLAHSCDYAHVRMHEITYLLDVAYILGTHLAYEYLGIRLHHLTHSAYHTHRGIIAPRGHEHIPLLLEYTVEIMLGRGLAITACYANYLQSGH